MAMKEPKALSQDELTEAARQAHANAVTGNPSALPAKPMDIFEYARVKSNLVNRILRALKDAPTDDMRTAIIAEVATFNKPK